VWGRSVRVMTTSTSPPAGVVVHRPVRAHPRPPSAGELVVAAPPVVGWTVSNLAGWLQYLVPLAGGGGSVAFLFTFPGPRPAWLVALVIGAAAASVAVGLALRLAERHAARRARRRERARYLAHLRQLASAVERLAAAQLAAAEHLHPDPPKLWTTVDQTDRLWERRPTDDDFLNVRVGRGPVPLAAPARLDTTAGPLAEHDPELLQVAESLVRRAGWLPGAPVTVPLRRHGVLAFTGPPDRTRALARAVLCELAAFHAPDDLRILATHPSGQTRSGAGWSCCPTPATPAALSFRARAPRVLDRRATSPTWSPSSMRPSTRRWPMSCSAAPPPAASP
jgi:S-DNA-T family DNA segregation ATPase FtsK/SpoIIIE